MKARGLKGIEPALMAELGRLDSRFLLAIAAGDADVVLLAKMLLAERSVGADGRWAEYSDAAASHGLIP